MKLFIENLIASLIFPGIPLIILFLFFLVVSLIGFLAIVIAGNSLYFYDDEE